MRTFIAFVILAIAFSADALGVRGNQDRRLSKSSSSDSEDTSAYAYEYSYVSNAGTGVQGNTIMRSSNGDFLIVQPGAGPQVIPNEAGTGATVIVPGAPITSTSVQQYSYSSAAAYGDDSSDSSDRRAKK
jgi:orotidine-5'-phosphate decarboxylase